MDMEWNQVLTFSEMVKDPVFLTGEISGLLGTEILVRMTQLTRSRCSITSSF